MSRISIYALCAAALAAACALAQRLEDTSFIPYSHKAIQYFETPPTDPIFRLEDRIEKKQVKLAYQPIVGYLPAVLKELDVPVDSQVLVYSPDSFQATLISRERPRAIYFNDTISVGYVPGGEVYELTAMDPKLGVNFYTLRTNPNIDVNFGRREVCLQCHQGGQTLAVPGLMVASAGPRGPGAEHGRSGYVTDHRTELAARWGGWYVSGTLNGQKHLGTPLPEEPMPFNPRAYLSPVSDVVALLTLEHQMRMTNLITRLDWDTRIAIADKKLDAAKPQIDADIDDMVAYMLFANEAPMQRIAGASTFSKTFPQRGPRDKKGRSLRDFDLQKRLFRYPLSYLIYTPSFDSIPDQSRQKLLQRLYDVLSGKDTQPKFAKISAADRQAVLEILRDTKQNLPSYWK